MMSVSKLTSRKAGKVVPASTTENSLPQVPLPVIYGPIYIGN